MEMSQLELFTQGSIEIQFFGLCFDFRPFLLEVAVKTCYAPFIFKKKLSMATKTSNLDRCATYF